MLLSGIKFPALPHFNNIPISHDIDSIITHIDSIKTIYKNIYIFFI